MMSTIPFFGLYGRSDTVEVIKVSGISLESCNVTPDPFGRLVKLRLATAKDKDMRAFGNESLRRRQTDSSRSAADDGDLACKSGHGNLLSVCTWCR